MQNISLTHLSKMEKQKTEREGDTFQNKQEKASFCVGTICMFTTWACLCQKKAASYLSCSHKHLVLQTFV